MSITSEDERVAIRVLVGVSIVAVVTMLVLGVLGYASARTVSDASSVLDWYVVSVVAVIGTVTLAGVLWKMKPGFREYSLRAVGIVFVATLVTLLASSEDGYRDSAMGILGAIAGYLFGKDAQNPASGKPGDREPDDGKPSGATRSGTTPDDTTPGDGTPDETKPEDTKPAAE